MKFPKIKKKSKKKDSDRTCHNCKFQFNYRGKKNVDVRIQIKCFT